MGPERIVWVGFGFGLKFFYTAHLHEGTRFSPRGACSFVRMLGKLEKKRRYFDSPYGVWGGRVPPPGQWRARWALPPEAPLLLEIGCGTGEFAVWMAERYPAQLVIGLDRKADRLATGCHLAAQKGLPNIGFWHGDAFLVAEAFAPGEVTTIWLHHPDPYPKRRQEKHRLVHPRFLWQYARILASEGRLHLRTDAPGLYEYALDQLHQANWRVVYHSPNLAPEEGPPEAHFPTRFFHRRPGPLHYIEALPPPSK
ncbi:MAG: tRNA (guanine(46)-N(7))-methyltransferase TrmB [Bacteroidetes bacterium]|nr:MAG: tRNA (guanine(46)-N(7))-methyltransferase TrmB [Bacteroidota bacterium]